MQPWPNPGNMDPTGGCRGTDSVQRAHTTNYLGGGYVAGGVSILAVRNGTSNVMPSQALHVATTEKCRGGEMFFE